MIDSSTLTVVCTAIPATLLALGTLITSMRNGTKTDTVIKKAEEIHTLTNSTMSQVRLELQVALTKIAEMERLVTALTAAAIPRDIHGSSEGSK